ncbi:MAG TPA: hypothetical protein VHX65_06405 [Pirellulales bacterium]|nr:hypothetical protein [Pirellulales bacterium]
MLRLLIVASVAAAPTGSSAAGIADKDPAAAGSPSAIAARGGGATKTSPAGTAAVVSGENHSDAVEVFHCDFGPQWDTNFDRWPDLWTRELSPSYPHYLPIRITDEPVPGQGRPLRIDLDGGAAAMFGPPFKVNTIFSYIVEAYVKTDGLVRDEAFVTITFYNAKKKPLDTFTSPRLRLNNDWTKVCIGPIAPLGEAVDHAVIGLHVEPTKRADVHGTAWFASVWAGRLPRMTIASDRRDNLFVEPDLPTITCTAAGFSTENSRVTFELSDVNGKVIAREDQDLEVAKGTASDQDSEAGGSSTTTELLGTATWSPPISDVGYYRVRVSMPGRAGVVHQRELSLAVIRDQPNPDRGEFGWTLPDGENPLTLNQLIDLVNHAGINWVKFPVWNGSQDTARSERLAWLAERLHFQHIEMVGLLHQPPPEVQHNLGDITHPWAAQIFATDPDRWYPSLEPILTSLSLKVRWWQLGLDKDTSFVGYPSAGEKIAQLRKLTARFGQKVFLGIGWSWLNELPPTPQAWDFVSLSADPPLTAQELKTYLDATAGCKTQRWVVLEPLPADEYSIETRASDLTRRMLAAKIRGADAAFVPQVFNSRQGLMNDDGTVGDLLLPWRTTALTLSGTEYLGSCDLPNGSVNHIFSRGKETMMVVWNDRPTQERMRLGEDGRQIDLWGHSTALQTVDGEQVIEVGRVPTFVTGLQGSLIRWRMSVRFAETQLPARFGVRQENMLLVKNDFGQGVNGKILLNVPDGWRTIPREFTFKLAAGETLRQPLEWTLPLDAASGKQDVRVDFDFNADRRYQFSVNRQIEIGQDDVTVQVNTRLNEHGELEIEQRLTNETDKVVSFKCYVYIPERQPLVTQVVELGRGTDTKMMRVANGSQLIGKPMLLRADEIGGERIINHRFNAQQ